MFYLFQLFAFFALLLAISLTITNKTWRLLYSAVAALLITLEFAAIYLTGSVIDYRFYNHMNMNAIDGHGFQFIGQSVFVVIVFILLAPLFYIVSKSVNGAFVASKKTSLFIALVASVFLSFPDGILSEVYSTYEIINADDKKFDQALMDVGILPEKYIMPNQLVAEKGKNIIVISLESIEQNFLGGDFEDLTPNLDQLANAWTFYNKMPPSPGGGWTAASLYNHQVGMPAFFKGQGNDFFQGSKNVKMTGLGHVFSKAGYNTKYLVGNAEFAGMSDILTAYGIGVVSQKNSLGKYPEVGSGLHDHDLFSEAKQQIETFRRDKNKPFAMFLSTINTHFPNGIYDVRMEEFVSKRENELEFSISAVDYLIGDFIDFLKKNNLLDDTAIYVFPDHLLMGGGGHVINKLRKIDRQLYLLTNIPEGKFPKKTTDTLYQIDLPSMIIAGAGIKTNATFLSDFIKTNDINNFLATKRVQLTSLNAASVAKSNYKSGINIYIENSVLHISSEKNGMTCPLNKNIKNENFDITFNSEMVALDCTAKSLKNIMTLHDYDKKFQRLHLIINIKDGKIDKTYFGNKQSVGVYKKGHAIMYAENEVQLVMESNVEAFEFFEKNEIELPSPRMDPTLASITSAEFITSSTIPSTIATSNDEFQLSRGLNLLTVDGGGNFVVDNFDVYGRAESANDFLSAIKPLIKNNSFWAVSAHDSIKTDQPGFKEELSDLGLKLLATLHGRVAYIAYSSRNKKIHEHSSDSAINYIVPSFVRPLENGDIYKSSQAQSNLNVDANAYSTDVHRFIAHAGGQVGPHKYTNSLEALSLNYKNGFRMFELDIIKTSDNHYVAAHDWKHWSKITNYKGDLPPDRNTFMAHKLHNNLTPIDMDVINVWFASHKDAILVTDKVNTPAEFSAIFVDKNRLMMELFSWAAVKDGVNAEIKSAMPTDSLLDEIQGDKISYLKKLGITDIASSRRILNSSPGRKIVTDLVNAGINIFAFHLHFDEGKDEMYVVCEERDYFYGMYADKWDFSHVLNCS